MGYLFTPDMASCSAEAGLLLQAHNLSLFSFDTSSVPWHAQFLLGIATPGQLVCAEDAARTAWRLATLTNCHSTLAPWS